MMHRIHIRIFLPVLLVVILMPLSAWFVFSATSDWYVRHMAKKQVSELIREIKQEAAEISAEESRTPAEEKEASKELFSRVKGNVRSRHPEAGLMVLNSKLKLVYPGGRQEGESSRDMYSGFTAMLSAGTLKAGNPMDLEAGGEKYAVELFEVESEANIRAKYFIAYAQIPNTALLLSHTGNLIALIAAAGLLLAAIAVWAVAGSIARPLKALCRQTTRIGNGAYQPITDHYAVLEIEKLKDSFNEMAEKLKHAEEQNICFFQNISHDLRTPLVSIAGYAQGIQCGVMKEPEKAAEIILTESLRMTNLVESILTISKMDNGRLKLNRTEIDLDDFLSEQTEVFKGIPNEKLLLMAEVEKDITAWADPDLLIRIFQNVISNCMRYAEARVEVRLELDGQWAVIIVEDDGPGIAEKDLPHIFERYYQGKNGNYGIGLYVVLTGMQYLGGKVSVSNREAPEHGALYRLYLPVFQTPRS